MNLNWHVMEDHNTLADEMARQVGLWLLDDLSEQERVTLAVSGGRTPVDFFRALSEVILPWERVDITLVDERWVPVEDARSNEALVRQHLLDKQAEAAHFIGLKTEHDSPEQGLESCLRRVSELTWPFSVVVLGMGEDGHTASWFPDAPELELALNPPQGQLLVAQRPPGQLEPRITWTLPVIVQARRRALLFEGSPKQQVFERALTSSESVEALPVKALLNKDLHVFWSAHES